MPESDFAEIDAAVDDVISSGEASQPASISLPETKSETKAPEAPARRFRGQFMDIVHPSSNVNLTNKTNNAAQNNPFKSPEIAAQTTPETAEPEPNLAAAPTSDDSSPETPADDSYQSPFLPNAKVGKRPLGSPNPDSDLKLLSNDEPEDILLSSGKDSNQELLSLAEESPTELLTAGEEKPDELLESGKESEALLSDGRENLGPKYAETDQTNKTNQTNQTENAELPKTADDKPKNPFSADHLPRRNAKETPASDTRAAINNTMIMPQYKSATTAPAAAANQSPYADAAQPMQRTKSKHFPVWAWIIVFILLAAAGVALGALLYTSGWLM